MHAAVAVEHEHQLLRLRLELRDEQFVGVHANETMVFSAIPNGYSFGCEGHTFLWDFGDTTVGSGINVFHTFTAPGTYIVKLTLTSELSPTLELTQTINVFTSVPAVDPRALLALALAIAAIAVVRLR